MEIIIPENWQEITLEQYMKFYKSIKPYEKTEDYQRKILENSIYYFCNISADVLSKIPQEVFMDLSNSMLELIKQSKNHELVLSFELMDQKYGFIPSIDNISYGEYVDLMTYCKDTWDNIPLIMSILYRPITQEKADKYDIEPYSGTVDSRVELFKSKMTMDLIFGALSFFLRLQQDLMTDILDYSIKEIKKIQNQNPDMKLEDIFKKNGVSISQLQHLQAMISSNSIELLD